MSEYIDRLQYIFEEQIMMGRIDYETCKDLYWNHNWSPTLFRTVFGFVPTSHIKKLQKEGYVKSLDMIHNSKKLTSFYKYGYDNPCKSVEVTDKTKKTVKRKYGGFPFEKQSETNKKMKKTNLEKYGKEIPMQNKEIAKRTGRTQQEKQEEYKKKNLEKYGVEYPSQLEEIRKKNSKAVIRALPKIYETKKKNGTFCTSNPEKDILTLLQKKFPDVLYQYRCEKYPFVCDFYIPSIDLFIEYQGTWTHGNFPFDEKDERCITELNFMKEKAQTSDFYKEAIETWTIRDVKKRNFAKEHNLNWVEFFNFGEFEVWYETIK